MMSEHLRFAPEILKRLGEELVSSIDQGILELVRNAYDADAVECRIELQNTELSGGTVRVYDNGDGMTLDSIRQGWLVLGRSPKSERPPVTRLGRKPIGEKGLGRLAALRMGTLVVLTSRPRDNPCTEYRVVIDWSRFDEVQTVEDVPIDITHQYTTESHGTSIEIHNIHAKIGQREVTRLARSLLLLADPFRHTSISENTGFRPVLVAPGFHELEQRVRESYFDEADYHLSASMTQDGLCTFWVMDRNGQLQWQKTATRENKSNAIEVQFEFWTFLLQTEKYTNRSITLTEIRQWLAVVGGIHLYHRGLRVHPYGDRGHDWLDMNLARARSPEERPSTNNSLGLVTVEDPRQILRAKTDRTGFIEDESFDRIRSFAKDALDWMSKERLREREEQRRAKRVRIATKREKALAAVEKAATEVSKDSQEDSVPKAIQGLRSTLGEEDQSTLTNLQLYRTLATVGTTVAVLAHESERPISLIQVTIKSIEKRALVALGESYNECLAKPVSIVSRASEALQVSTSLVLNMLRHEKRRLQPVPVNQAVQDTLRLFHPYLKEFNVTYEVDLEPTEPHVWSSQAAFESIVSNLVFNSVRAFELGPQLPNPRVLCIQTSTGNDSLCLTVMDSGPGIVGIAVKDIWLPGQTTIPGGTGLGLTIVKDTVADMGGTIRVKPNGQQGGAEFLIELPLHKETL